MSYVIRALRDEGDSLGVEWERAWVVLRVFTSAWLS